MLWTKYTGRVRCEGHDEIIPMLAQLEENKEQKGKTESKPT